MTLYFKKGNQYNPTAEASVDLHKTLPVGTYIIGQDAFGNMYFEIVDDVTVPSKLYGNTTRHADRIMNTFLSRESATGVMLAGEKGSGKSLLAKKLSIDAAAKGIPTIIINAPWCGDNFNKFIQDLQQPCVILFDEFEKVYDRDGQEKILTLLDGVFPTKKLFVLTCNDKWRVDVHMRNRPGRIYYMIEYNGLESDFIREYCEDNLNNKEHIDTICKITGVFSKFNFDMLKALVEEMNRYNETPQEVMELLNAKPEFEESNTQFKMNLTVDGVQLDSELLYSQSWSGNPVKSNQRIKVEYKCYDGEGDWDWESKMFETNDLVKVDPSGNSFIFVNNDKNTLVLTKEKPKHFNYYDAF